MTVHRPTVQCAPPYRGIAHCTVSVHPASHPHCTVHSLRPPKHISPGALRAEGPVRSTWRPLPPSPDRRAVCCRVHVRLPRAGRVAGAGTWRKIRQLTTTGPPPRETRVTL